MIEDFGYGDCRDECIQYLIEGEYACQDCAAEMDMAERQAEEEYFFGEGSQ